MTQSNKTKSASNGGANLGFEAKLWAAADALRNNMDAAEYMPAAERSDPNYRDVVLERNLRCTNVQGKRSSPLESMDEVQRPARA